jgi:subtilisin family serine protease
MFRTEPPKVSAIQTAVILLLAMLAPGLVLLLGQTPASNAVAWSEHWISAGAEPVTETTHLYLPLVMRAYRPPPPPPVYPNDPYYYTYGYQWGLNKVRAPEAWALSTGQGVLIAVLDTGTDYNHPDLSGKVRTDIAWNFVNNNNDARDNNGHGTHVSGIAAAATNNSRGVAGMGWDASILPLKVLDSGGNGRTDQLISAIYYAADHGARVINMSLGGPYSCLSDLQAAVDYAYSRGALLVAAAGNDYKNQTVFPANCAHVLGVAATGYYDTLASFSVTGTHVSVAAPGTSIYSTLWGGGYGYMQGTSMATPFVAGLAALVYARFPTYTPNQAASAILDNAQDLGSTGWDIYYGCGRIDAFRALWEGARGDYPVCLGARVWSATGAGEQGSGGAGEPEGGGAEEQRSRGAEEQRGRGAEEQRSAGAGEVIPGEVVVTLRAGARAEALFRAQGLDPAGALLYRARSGIQVWRLRVPVGQEEAVLARLRADPAVIAADRNYRIRAQ